MVEKWKFLIVDIFIGNLIKEDEKILRFLKYHELFYSYWARSLNFLARLLYFSKYLSARLWALSF